MATLSAELKLKDGIWQEMVTPCVAQKLGSASVEVVNADVLPVGDVPEAQTIEQKENLSFNAPASGSLYIRARYNGSEIVKYYRV